jgi:hypothetical protein
MRRGEGDCRSPVSAGLVGAISFSHSFVPFARRLLVLPLAGLSGEAVLSERVGGIRSFRAGKPRRSRRLGQ